MRRTILGICAGFLLLSGEVLAGGKPAPAPHAKSATPAMWTIHGAQGTVYMLGSIHALPKNIKWQTPQLMTALNQSDTFVFEVPMNAESRAKAVQYFRQNALLPRGLALPSMFDSEMRSDFRQVVMLTHADPSFVVYMRPWLAALVLEGAATGTDALYPAEGVDNKVYAMAKSRGVTQFRALERDEDQFRLFIKDGHEADEVADLRLVFKDILANRGSDGKPLIDAWMHGDTKAIARLVPENKATTAAFRKAWIEDRNRKWVPQIEAMLDENRTFFVTVGAAHLVGKTGVPNLMRAAGYRVEGP